MRWIGSFIVLVALEQTFNVTRFFDLFLSAADFSKFEASVDWGNSQKFSPVSLQLNIWFKERSLFSHTLLNSGINF